MAGITPPQAGTIARPQAPQPGRIGAPVAPQRRAMDAYDSSVAEDFRQKEDGFYSGSAHDDDTVISILSSFGNFKVETYANQGNPNDIHHVVFFYNKEAKETYEVHGTIARFYKVWSGGLPNFGFADLQSEYR
jgi:hypothetical protein